jgi:hypothetical protein
LRPTKGRRKERREGRKEGRIRKERKQTVLLT